MQIFWLKVVNFSHTIIHSIYEENAELCVSSLEVWAPVDQICRVVTWRYLKFVLFVGQFAQFDCFQMIVLWNQFSINFKSFQSPPSAKLHHVRLVD